MEKKKVCMVVAVALVLCMSIVLVGCASSGGGVVTDTGSAQTTEPTQESTEATEFTTQPVETEGTEPVEEEETEPVEEEETEPEFDFSFDVEERPSEEESDSELGEDGNE